MTNPTNTVPRIAPGGPPPITRARTVRGLRAMQALLAAGRLLPGDVLEWAERGRRHRAVVLASGRLLVAGQLVNAPSTAGQVVGNRRPSGWDAWVCVRDGVTLAAKRAQIGLDPR